MRSIIFSRETLAKIIGVVQCQEMFFFLFFLTKCSFFSHRVLLFFLSKFLPSAPSLRSSVVYSVVIVSCSSLSASYGLSAISSRGTSSLAITHCQSPLRTKKELRIHFSITCEIFPSERELFSYKSMSLKEVLAKYGILFPITHEIQDRIRHFVHCMENILFKLLVVY
jgi:hypothetical protein